MSVYEPTENVLRAIIQKAQKKLEVAKKDFELGYYGDAVSRAYYAAFHSISAVLSIKGLTFSSHAQTLGAFNREFVKSGIFPRDTYRKIQRLFEDRQEADYTLIEEFEDSYVKKQIQLCSEFLIILRSHFKSVES